MRFSDSADVYDDEEESDVGRKPVKAPPVMESTACWTHEPEFEKHLVLRLFKPSGLRIATGNKDGRYVLRAAPGVTTAMQSSGFFPLGAASLTGPDAGAHISDFIVDARTLLPEEAQFDLSIGDRVAAIGTINLRQLAASEPSPVILPHANAPIPQDYPYAIRVSVPLYSTSLGSSVRVAVGTLPIAVFGIRYEIAKFADHGTSTDIVEEQNVVVETQRVEPTVQAPMAPPALENTSAQQLGLSTATHVPADTASLVSSGGVSAISSQAHVPQAAQQSVPEFAKPTSSSHSVALSPVRWDTVASPDREPSDLAMDSESVSELKRKFQ